ncbi:uncharacterized protein LOC126213116 isoform X7 [Schistocerca nitens]|uniref:uncharacterized protein LOC126213116 isoform X7 n=1 Tax=Schistocerca nitens TaxID=7011 RepID=UPI0021187DC5|nr:uncharacterized protein LOC126213116 isoform X7 [Schistocerca nitens]
MDQEPAMWIKKEETDEVKTELPFMAQVYPFSMNVKEELEEGANKESIEDPLGISWSTDFIKEDPELNLELSVADNIYLEDPFIASGSTDHIKEDSVLNLGAEEIETFGEMTRRCQSQVYPEWANLASCGVS